MNSIEKVQGAIDYLHESDDAGIHEAFPFMSPGMVRGALVVVEAQIPNDVDELDTFLGQVGDFCHSLRSDPDGT